MFAMNMTRQRERDANKARQKEALREAQERKLQRELAREAAKAGGGAAEQKNGDTKGAEIIDVSENGDKKRSKGGKTSKKK